MSTNYTLRHAESRVFYGDDPEEVLNAIQAFVAGTHRARTVLSILVTCAWDEETDNLSYTGMVTVE